MGHGIGENGYPGLEPLDRQHSTGDVEPQELARCVITTIQQHVAEAGTTTGYREPRIGFVAADDPRFFELCRAVGPAHLLPHDLLPGARSVVSFFLPFARWVVEANAQHSEAVAREWATAYIETNDLIGRINAGLVQALARRGIRAAAEPATHNWDPATFTSRWSHKSVAVVAGLGSFGLHQMVITDAGCAGRFGSLVLDADLPSGLSPGPTPPEPRERCLYFHDGSCLECVGRCPVGALDPNDPFDKQRCHRHLHSVAQAYEKLGKADVCGKCAIGPCSFQSAVP
jgi:epoxyqueuosine reductase